MDRISTFPDEILCHILSFIGTEEAVATSLLSKRWRHLWTSVSALDFNQYRFNLTTRKTHSCFVKFVNASILARDMRQPIRNFRLEYGPFDNDCYFHYDGSPSANVNEWVNTAMQHGIENLEISVSRDYSFMNFRILSCRTLVVLKLKQVELYVSFPVELPSLKTLHLEGVSFELHSFWELIRGTPFLEDLKAHDVGFRGFRYHDKSLLFEQEFQSLPKLVTAVLSDIDFNFPLKIISNAVHVVFTSMSTSMNWILVLEILKNCPKLQDFELGLSEYADSMTLLPHPHFVPECLTSGFRKCSLKNYKASRCEQHFAEYIMRGSTSLRTMTICSRSSSSTEAKDQMLEELASCPRRSALCELLFK